MRYVLDGKLVPYQEGEKIGEGAKLIQVIRHEDYIKEYAGSVHHRLLIYKGAAEYCKVDMLGECVVGTFVIPDKESILKKEITFDFYMTADKFIFIDDSGIVADILNQLTEIEVYDQMYLAHFLFEFMIYLIQDDVFFLQEYENKLAKFEEVLIHEKARNVNQFIFHKRRELLIMEKYYRQMTDLSETLESNTNRLFTEEDCRIFALFAKRVSRLYDNVQNLREYSVQLREMYQSQIEVRQNKIMKFLTVVTTIFMPLTLVTGWYGMNFVHMPELAMKYGYLAVIIVSVVITLLEIWIFKIKKWFD